MRSGTLPTHQLVGFGEAARLVSEQLATDEARIRELRDRLWAGISSLGDVWVNGDLDARVANHLNVSFAGVDGEILLASLAKVAVSSGSACTSASVEPSYVLKAIGRSDQLAHAGLRMSVGRYTTEEEIDFAIAEVSRVVSLLRKQ
jgi:cysteine desulfurase